MIWRILGTVGAASFFFTGFAVLTDPTCVTADFGGGRVSTITCRADSFGSMSGGAAGSVALLIGGALLILIYWNAIQRYLGGNSMRREMSPRIETRPTQDSKTRITSMKSCDKCGKEMDTNWGHCPVCLGTTFTHKQRELKPLEYTSEEAFPAPANPAVNTNPEFKECPMCAEEIKFKAIKCRYCGSDI